MERMELVREGICLTFDVITGRDSVESCIEKGDIAKAKKSLHSILDGCKYSSVVLERRGMTVPQPFRG